MQGHSFSRPQLPAWELASLAWLALTITVALFGYGGAPLAVQWVVVAMGALGALAAMLWKPRLALQSWSNPVVFAAGALTAWTFVQGLPMPFAWVQALSPSVARGFAETQALLHLVGSQPLGSQPLAENGAHSTAASVAWATLSADPAATWHQTLRALGLLCISVHAHIAHRCLGLQKMLWVLLIPCLSVLLSALIHMGTGWNHFFSIDLTFGSEVGPHAPIAHAALRNPNTMAGLCILTMSVALALLFRIRERASDKVLAPALLLAAALLPAGFALMTRSRAGIVASLWTALVMCLLVALHHIRRRDHIASPAARSHALPLATPPAQTSHADPSHRRATISWGSVGAVLGCMLLGIALGAWGIEQELIAEFDDEDQTKWIIHRHAADLLFDAPIWGVGRGAFSSAFMPHWSREGWADYPENFALQWGLEWGLIVSVLLVAALLWLMLRVLRAGSLAHALMAVGLMGFALQNWFDLGTELLSLQLLATIMLVMIGPSIRLHPRGASLSHGQASQTHGQEGQERDPQRPPFASWSMVLVPITTLGMLASLAPTITHMKPSLLRHHIKVWQAEASHGAIPTASVSPATKRKHATRKVRRNLRRAARLHPMDARVFVEGAVFERNAHPLVAAAWNRRAAALAPGWVEVQIRQALDEAQHAPSKTLPGLAESHPHKVVAAMCASVSPSRMPQVLFSYAPHPQTQTKASEIYFRHALRCLHSIEAHPQGLTASRKEAALRLVDQALIEGGLGQAQNYLSEIKHLQDEGAHKAAAKLAQQGFEVLALPLLLLRCADCAKAADDPRLEEQCLMQLTTVPAQSQLAWRRIALARQAQGNVTGADIALAQLRAIAKLPKAPTDTAPRPSAGTAQGTAQGTAEETARERRLPANEEEASAINSEAACVALESEGDVLAARQEPAASLRAFERATVYCKPGSKDRKRLQNKAQKQRAQLRQLLRQ